MGERFLLNAREYAGHPDRKRFFNERHFTEAAPRYDLATKAMSLGRDSAWKRRLVAALPGLPAPVCVDIACGTGDVTFLLAERYPGGTIEGLDLTPSMLAIANRRNRFSNVRFEPGDMDTLPYPDGSVDIVTGAYALRNAPELRTALAEIHRILKPTGVAAILDFSKPSSPILQTLQYALLRGWCGFWGFLMHGTPEIHGYIADSLKGFPDRRRFLATLQKEGFRVSSSNRFCLGITELIVMRHAR